MPLLRAIGRLARYTTKYMQIDLIRLPSRASTSLVLIAEMFLQRLIKSHTSTKKKQEGVTHG